MGRPRSWRWAITSTSADAELWAIALRSRDIAVELRTTWPARVEADVVVCVGDPPPLSGGDGSVGEDARRAPMVIDLPPVVARGATPDAVAEYLLSRVRAATSESALAQYRRDQNDVTERVTHDLKNSISVVQANFAFLRGVMPSEKDFDDAIEDAHEATRQMDRALTDLSLMTALELGIEPMTRDVVRLSVVVDATRATWARRLATRDLTLDSRLPEDLCAIGRASMLRAAFENIIGTRVRCARNGAIEVRGASDGVNVEVLIADHGLCAAPEDRARVFDKAGTRPAREMGSLGVALYLARLIIEAHGGEISLVELPPFTSCFRVVLPAVLSASISPNESR